MRALIVEDKDSIRRFLRQGLVEHSFAVEEAEDGSSGLELARGGRFDVIILDLMLPGLGGLDLLEQLRASGDATPVLCLTARDSVEDRVRGLDLGADDYLTKPYSFTELLARIRALLRRGPELRPQRVAIADLEIDLNTHAVRRGGERIDLTTREFSLLSYLAKHTGDVVSRKMILDRIWDVHLDPKTNVIDVHINRLRKKVDGGRMPRLIHTIRGVGYSLRAEEK